MKSKGRKITSDPDICNGKPIIEGTRITVQTILEFLAAGDSIENIKKNYPSLSREDILECLAYASKILNNSLSIDDVA